METKGARTSFFRTLTIAGCALVVGCTEDPVTSIEPPDEIDVRAEVVFTLLADPWLDGLVQAMEEPSLRRSLTQFDGDVEALARQLQRAQAWEISPEDRLRAAILELSLMAADRPPSNAESSP